MFLMCCWVFFEIGCLLLRVYEIVLIDMLVVWVILWIVVIGILLLFCGK